MSNIVLIINDTATSRTEAIAAVRRQLGLPFRDLTKALDAKHVCFNKPLFTRDDPALPSRLVRLMTELDDLGVTYEAYEVLDGQDFDESKRASYYQITKDRLENMMFAREVSLEQQRDRGFSEGGGD